MINLTDTTSQIAELQRRQKLAEALAAQADQPIEVQSYKGIQAPISPFSVLAKVLDTYTSKKDIADAIKREAEVRNTERDQATNYLQNYEKMPDFSKFENPVSAQEATQQAAIPALTPVAPAGPPETMQVGGVPDMQGNVTPSATVQAPMPQVYNNAQPSTYAGPQATVTPGRATTPQERMASLLQASMSGNPILEKMAPALYEKASQKNDVNELLSSINVSGLPSNIQQQINTVVGSGGSATDVRNAIMKAQEPQRVGDTIQQLNMKTGTFDVIADARTKWEQVPTDKLSPDQLKALPPGQVILRSNNGDIKVVNTSDAESILKIQQENEKYKTQHAPELAIQNANLGLRREEMNRSRLAPPTTIEHIVNGEPVQLTAMFDNKNGRYVDMTGNVVDPTGLRVLPSGGARSTLGLLRVSTAAADAATGLENLSKLPANSKLGWFSQAGNTPLSALNRTLSPQEAQDMAVTMAGMSRAMGGLATGGLSVDSATQASYEALVPKAGQSRLTSLRQMGEFRQQAENGIESALANPYITPNQKKFLVAAKTKIANAVPWTPSDVSALETSGKSNATMRSMGTGVPLANNGAPVTPTAPATGRPLTDAELLAKHSKPGAR
jgi:hypothetical protein